MSDQPILCPVDFDAASLAAVSLAVAEAKLRDCTLHLMHAWEPGLEYAGESPPIPFAAELPRERIEADLAALPLDLPTDRVRVHATAGEPREDIVRLAKELDCQLVVMGTHARKGLPHWIVGSVCESVLRSCPCPVLVCRGPEKTD